MVSIIPEWFKKKDWPIRAFSMYLDHKKSQKNLLYNSLDYFVCKHGLHRAWMANTKYHLNKAHLTTWNKGLTLSSMQRQQ